MTVISELCDMIDEELNDADKYIRCALKWKMEKPTLAAAFAKLSGEEMNHMAILHEQVTLLIQEYRKEHGEPPEKMQWVYDYLHQKQMDKAAGIRFMQGQFKG